MGTKRTAQRVSLGDRVRFSSDIRVNQEILATAGLVVRMNCYEPGQVTPMHMHPDEDEVLYIVEGQGTVGFEHGPDLPVVAGDLVCLPSDRFHQITAGPTGRMVLIYFMKPGYESIRPGDGAGSADNTRLPGERAAE